MAFPNCPPGGEQLSQEETQSQQSSDQSSQQQKSNTVQSTTAEERSDVQSGTSDQSSVSSGAKGITHEDKSTKSNVSAPPPSNVPTEPDSGGSDSAQSGKVTQV